MSVCRLSSPWKPLLRRRRWLSPSLSEEALAVKEAERPLDDALQPLREADFTLAAEPDRFTLATEAELTAFRVIV